MEKIFGILICFLVGGALWHFWPTAHREFLVRGREIINKYLIYFGLPFFIVVSLISHPAPKLLDYALLIGIFLILINGAIFLLVKFSKFNLSQKGSLFLCSTYGNWAYLGIPTAYVLFGSTGLILSSVAALMKGIFHFSLGIYLSNLFQKVQTIAIKRVLKTPLIYAFLVAFLLARFSLSVPNWLFQGACSAIYLAALVGLSLSFRGFEKSLIFFGTIFKFGIWPILTFLFLLFFDLFPLEKKTLLLLAFAPPALVNTNLCLEYNFDYKFASSFTTLSTIGFLIAVLILGVVI